jgi:CBS domain-containing protein
MHPFLGSRPLPTSFLVGVPLLLAGSAAASVLFYRSGNGETRRARAARRTRRQVRDVMSEDPACCTVRTPLREVAEMMITNDCGEIPVCDEARKPIGVVTDRDIVCRLFARGYDPFAATAKDCMSRPVITCTADTSIEDCARFMERHQVRRMPVLDGSGAVCGIVSQADLARKGPQPITAQLVEQISEPIPFASSVDGR